MLVGRYFDPNTGVSIKQSHILMSLAENARKRLNDDLVERLSHSRHGPGW